MPPNPASLQPLRDRYREDREDGQGKKRYFQLTPNNTADADAVSTLVQPLSDHIHMTAKTGLVGDASEGKAVTL